MRDLFQDREEWITPWWINMNKILLGKISYLNVLPIYYPLENQIIKNNFKIIEGIPAHLNHLASQGKLDLSGTSSIEYAKNFEKYLLIPHICIGSNGPVKSVLFLSKIPIKRLGGKKIIISSHTHTSAALLKLIFKRDNIEVIYKTGNISEYIEKSDIYGILAIGDEALTLRKVSNFPYILDLGEEWQRWTGFPFVFGVWIVTKKAMEKRPDVMKIGCKLLLHAKDWGLKRLEFFAKITEEKTLLSYNEALSYFRGLVYEMNENEIKGLKCFYRFLYEAKLISKKPKICFAI